MSQTASVSVALCTYNGAKFMRRQLDSIVGQTRLPDEIVIADDGSVDGTLAIVADFARTSAVPLRVLDPGQRLGVTANFERAAKATSGSLIALSDQDDIWHPKHVERLLEPFRSRPDLLLVHSDARLVDAAERPLGTTLLDALRVAARDRAALAEGDAFGVLLRRNLATGATMVVRRELLDRATPFPSSWVHDEWLAIVAASLGGAMLLDMPLLDYRQHDDNVIGMRALSVKELLRRLVEPSGERLNRLAAKWRDLVERAESLGLDSDSVDSLREKAAFEEERSRDPAARLLRTPRVLQRLITGRYGTFASQGRADAIRDLTSPR